MRERITDDDDEKEKDDDVPGNFFCFVCFGDVPFFFYGEEYATQHIASSSFSSFSSSFARSL